MIWLKLVRGARSGLRAVMVPFELMLLARRLAGGRFLTDLASVGNKEMDLFLKAVMAVCDMAATRVQQTLDFVEIFSGSEGLSRAVSRLGLEAEAFDRNRHRSENICRLEGLLYAASLIMQVKRGGCVWFAPQCSSWLTFLSAGHTKRCQGDELGDCSRRDVREANVTSMIVSHAQ